MKLAADFPPELLSRVEDASLNASAPPEQLLMDGWLVRYCPGKAKRARCINAIAPGRLSLSERIALCEPVYEGAGLPIIMRITPFSVPAGLDDALDMLGWRRFDDTRVMVLAGFAPPQAPAPGPGLVIEPTDSECFAEEIGRLRGSPPSQRAAHVQRLARAPVPHTALLARREGQVVACGQMAIETNLVGLYDIYTAASERDRGLGRLLCQHLLQRAHELGARSAYLQVDADNAPARRIYERLGFADAYAYHYRTSDPDAQ
jgi:ribosomal protein S18 acetylase RimI-like enzyme